MNCIRITEAGRNVAGRKKGFEVQQHSCTSLAFVGGILVIKFIFKPKCPISQNEKLCEMIL